MMFLKQVVKEKIVFVKHLKSKLPLRELKKKERLFEKKPFYDIFSKRTKDEARIIAEIKKASPTRKIFNANINVVDQARFYIEGGAKAISIITEQKHFLGNKEDITKVKQVVSIPVLRKDFIVDEYEIYESFILGADAILLIGEALEKSHLVDLILCAREVGLDIIFEIHSLKTWEQFSDYHKHFLLGINNRDLETLKIDMNTAFFILNYLPEDVPVIIESGIETREDIEKFLAIGVSGFLVGSSIMASENPTMHIKKLLGVEK